MNYTKKTTSSQDNSTQNGKNKPSVDNTIVLNDSIAKTSDNPTIESVENMIQLSY